MKGVLCFVGLVAVCGVSLAGPRYDRVDHFWWLVRDLPATEAFFRDTLGFTLGPDVDYPFADLRHVWFEDASFLELVSQPAGRPVLGEAVTAFLGLHEGAWKMGVFVGDVEEIARDLRERGLRVSEPEGGTWRALGGRELPAEEMWIGVDLLGSPGHLAYFWHFTPRWDAMRARLPAVDPLGARFVQHANTALGFRTPWLATWDLERMRRDLGFLTVQKTEPPFDVPRLRARGGWVELQRGRILVLEPESDEGPVMEFLFTRGEGVLGASIEVQSLDRARQLIESRSGRRFVPYAGLEGASILLPASFTHGVALELFERRGSP
jgi:catechol 2,3-dioxygenase-like lactoylglutathione lyase family enzyme